MFSPYAQQSPTVTPAQQTLQPQQDPRSQYLAQALQQLQNGAGQNIRTPGALGSNLMADALLRYGLNKRQSPNIGLPGNPNIMLPGNLDNSVPTGPMFGGG